MYSPAGSQVEQIKNIVSEMAGSNTAVIQGYITSVNPNTTPYTVKVMLEPYEVESGWLPVQTPYVGPNCGLIIPPPEELTPVIVVCELGHIQAGKVIAMQWNDDIQEPNVTAGTFGLIHKSGAKLLLNPDGSISLLNSGGYGLTVSNSGQVTIKGSTSTGSW